MRVYIIILITIFFSCNHPQNEKLNQNKIWEVDTLVNSSDSIFTDSYERSYVKKYSSDGKLIYTGMYSNNKLNGQIEIHSSSSAAYVMGHMKDNKPYGLWLFSNERREVDSVKIIFDKKVMNIDRTIFKYDTLTLSSGDILFLVKKPVEWDIITDDKNNNVGMIESSKKDTSKFLNSVFFNTESFSNNKIDYNFAAKFLISEIRKVYSPIKIINEGYYPNYNLGGYYLVEFEGYNKGLKFLISISLFIKENKLYTLLGTIRFKSDSDYHLYSWLLKDIFSSLKIGNAPK